ncbi:hypothetical protein D9756_009673 [Leucocoprinus leucothites]|uniref:Uncharacterized protein n=1 Tax=Leucocoprinus leucothites TaxID=201217 RepID=A0A8H5FSZ7_9AGAR|nr:hypothetical protein D9756_009673 [Leucoagaricus leucothites]
MGSLPSQCRLPEHSSGTAPSKTCSPRRSSNTAPAQVRPAKHPSSTTSQSQSRSLNHSSNATPSHSRSPNHPSNMAQSQPRPPERSSDVSAPRCRPPEPSSGGATSQSHPPGPSSNTPPSQVRCRPEHSSNTSPSQASLHKNSANTKSQPSNGKTVDYTLDSIARRNAQLDRDEEELHKHVVVTEENDQTIMNWIHALRKDEDELTQRSITDCVCHHEPSCPNSRIFECLEGYSRFNPPPISVLSETTSLHVRAEERSKRQQQSKEGNDQPPGYQEANLLTPSRYNRPPGTSPAVSSKTPSSDFDWKTSQSDQGCNERNKAIASITERNELEAAYNAVECRAAGLEKSWKEIDQVESEQNEIEKEGVDWLIKLRVVRFEFEKRAGECTCRHQGSS